MAGSSTLKLFIAFLFIAGSLSAQEYSGNQIQLIKTGISYYVDTDENSNIENIKSLKFLPFNKEILNFYRTNKKSFWLHFHLKNNSSEPTLFLNIDYSLIDKLTLYEVAESGNTNISSQGFANRRSRQTPLFNLNLKPAEAKDYYLKVETKTPVFLPLEIGPQEKFVNNFLKKDIITGLYFGIMMALFLYNALIYFIVKDKNYIYYIIYTLFMALTQVTLLGYFWRIFGSGNAINYYTIIILPSIAGISNIIFAKAFMNLKDDLPKANKYFNVFIFVYLFAIVLVFFNQYYYAYRIIDANVLVLAIYALAVAIVALRRGSRPAYFFFIAWVVLLLSLISYTLRNFEVLPFNKVPSYLLYIGSAIQTILLSIALADRINVYKKQTEVSQQKALDVSLENEQLVREQNVVLEKEVENRTYQLKETNTQLSTALTNLKDTQTQLVEAEKMASLGQLTAGIAHEINNPINFVKSNITPLRLDVKDLMEVLDAYDELHALGENGIKERLDAIQELKGDIDLPYVQNEITSLIAGIEEGAERTAEIVRGLRTFSRIDEAALKTVNIHEGILSTIVLLKNNIPYYINLVKEFNAKGEIECFPGKLNQVFMNIITNATQAITSKKVKNAEESIVIKTRDIENEQVEISIKDSGMGMTEEVKHKIFEPFFTTKEVGEGTGLGMAIVFKIIQKHNGKINIISAPDQGSEFVITLPHKYQGID